MKNTKGFTLVELLVVIAIIGTLSSVAVVNLNTAREKGRQAAVQGLFSQTIAAAIICIDEGQELTHDGSNDCNGSNNITAGTKVCDSTTAEWPSLTSYSGWSYGFCNSPISDDTFSFTAEDTGGRSVTCTEDGCTATP